MKQLQNKANGFSLVELITVIVILGIVGTVALGKFENMAEDAHNAVARGAVAEFISIAMTTYYNYKIERDADTTPVKAILYNSFSLQITSIGI